MFAARFRRKVRRAGATGQSGSTLATVLKTVLVVVLIAEIAVVVILSQRDDDVSARPPSSGVSPEPDPVDVSEAEFVSDDGGYAFVYPRSWQVTERRTVTRLESPSGNAVLSAGLGPPGTLRSAANDLIAVLQRTYDDVAVDGIVGDTVGDLPALRVEATGRNQAGTHFRFLGVAIEGPDRIFTVASFARGATRQELVQRIDEVLESFELSQSPSSA